MTHLAALEASSRVTTVFGGSSTAVRDFHTNLVAHEVALVVLGYALFRSFSIVEFLQGGKRFGHFSNLTEPSGATVALTTNP